MHELEELRGGAGCGIRSENTQLDFYHPRNFLFFCTPSIFTPIAEFRGTLKDFDPSLRHLIPTYEQIWFLID